MQRPDRFSLARRALVLAGMACLNAAAGAQTVPPPDESHATKAIGVCGPRHFDTRIEFCDKRNDRLYRFTTVGAQTWMAENLDYGPMVSGGQDQPSGSKYCLYDDAGDCGALYQWAVVVGLDGGFNGKSGSSRIKDRSDVQGICPSGWRVPSSADWDILLALVRKEWGADREAVSLMAYSADDKFRWKTNTDPDNMLPLHDRYGMSIIPSGQRVLRGTCPDGPPSDSFFCSAHDMAEFWTSDEDPVDPTIGASITVIEDLPYVANSTRPVFDRLKPEEKTRWTALMKEKAATQSALQRSYKASMKVQGMSLRCIRRG